MSRFITLCTKDYLFNGHKYELGLNICSESDKLYFCNKNDIRSWIYRNRNVNRNSTNSNNDNDNVNDVMFYIWDVSIPDNEKIFNMGNYYTSKKFILSNKRCVFDDYNLCYVSIKTNPYSIRHISNTNNEKYNNMCELAVKLKPDIIKYINPQIKNYKELCILALKSFGYLLTFIPEPYKNMDEICKVAVKQNGIALQYVSPELMTDEICKVAVKKMVMH